MLNRVLLALGGIVVAAAVYWLGVRSEPDQSGDRSRSTSGKSFARPALDPGSAPAAATLPDSGRGRGPGVAVAMDSLPVTDGWKRRRPGVAFRLDGPRNLSSVRDVVADETGMLRLPPPEAGAEIDARTTLLIPLDPRVFVLSPTWADARAVGGVLIAEDVRVKGTLVLRGVAEEVQSAAFASVLFTVVPLPEVSYVDRDANDRVTRALVRSGLIQQTVKGDRVSLDRESGRFRLDVQGVPDARLLVSLEGWTSAVLDLEAAVLADGDLGEVVLERLTPTRIRVACEEGVKVPKSLAVTMWRDGRLGDTSRADAIAGSISARGGMWQILDPDRGVWAAGRHDAVSLKSGAGAWTGSPGFRLELLANDLEPNVLATQSVGADGEVVLSLTRARHAPDVLIATSAGPLHGARLTLAAVDDPAQVNRSVALDDTGRMLREHFEHGRTYSLLVSGARHPAQAPTEPRYLRWAAGTTEVQLDSLPTRP